MNRIIGKELQTDMTVKECYEMAGADFDDAMNRLGSEALIKRFAVKFLQDKNYEELKNAMQAQDAERAFRAAHTLKGVCANLGFKELLQASSDLTEKLRGRELEGSEPLYGAVSERYMKVIEAVTQLDNSFGKQVDK